MDSCSHGMTEDRTAVGLVNARAGFPQRVNLSRFVRSNKRWLSSAEADQAPTSQECQDLSLSLS
jgi:hypothetical protein